MVLLECPFILLHRPIVVDMKLKIPTGRYKGFTANYMIKVNGRPIYCGQSKDVFKRVGKHRSMMKNHKKLATGVDLPDLDWHNNHITFELFNIYMLIWLVEKS